MLWIYKAAGSPDADPMPPTVLLHGSHDVSWTAWHFEPTVVVGALVVGGLYLLVALRTASLTWRKAAFFYAGSLIVFIGLVSPLDAAADRLLSMHMLQHVVLTTVGPPLVLLGLAPAMFQSLLRPGNPNRIALFLTHPVFAAAALIINMWIWHAPPLYEAALRETPVHATMHIAFIATGLLFWMPVIQPLPQLANLGHGARLLYLFVTGFPMEILALLFIASSTVVYDFYLNAPRLFGLSAIEDQQIAGIIMGAVGQAAAFVAITLLFFRFLDQEEEREAANDLAARGT